MFKKASRHQSKLRMSIDGPAGSGKTFTALRFAHTLAAGGRIAVIDTEHGSASKYVGEVPDSVPWEFDALELQSFSPDRYTEAIQLAGRSGYTVCVVDSLSHAWAGKDGALELKDRMGGNQFTAWRNVTPLHDRMIDAILQAPLHVITTMRSKMEYVQETDERGKVTIRKVGLAPVQRPGMEYEFDVVIDIDWAHVATVTKSRCSAIADAKAERPGPDFITPLIEWLSSGVAVTPKPPTPTLDELLTQWHPDVIMRANDGKIPTTEAELATVAARLAEEVKF